ncbi:uncharacterized protein LOC132041370 isoform X2 [Lycium ferocissimum]|uniref:uncharacterized protein LOC132041370 isoform X2 n=1 Tax=Lycium ferocissimum TaxID=112874 RepID=UPI002814D4CE|nr:uncharacterized protein LOC132041370 isoform X2 [Lycium ferocissimum]
MLKCFTTYDWFLPDYRLNAKGCREVWSVVAFLCRWEQIDRVCNTSWTQCGGASILNWGYSLLPTSLPLYCGWPVLVAAAIALLISRTTEGLSETAALPFKVGVRSAYTLPSPDPTWWDSTGLLVVVAREVIQYGVLKFRFWKIPI